MTGREIGHTALPTNVYLLNLHILLTNITILSNLFKFNDNIDFRGSDRFARRIDFFPFMQLKEDFLRILVVIIDDGISSS